MTWAEHIPLWASPSSRGEGVEPADSQGPFQASPDYSTCTTWSHSAPTGKGEKAKRRRRSSRGGNQVKVKTRKTDAALSSLQTPPCPGAGSSFRSLRCPGGPDSVKERGRRNLWETEDSHPQPSRRPSKDLPPGFSASRLLAGVAGVGAASRALLSPCSNELQAPALQTSGTALGAHSPQPRRASSCKADPLVIFCHRLHIRCFPVASANSLCKAAFIYRKLQPRRLALK